MPHYGPSSQAVLNREGPMVKHPAAVLQKTGTRASNFVISPDWISENYNGPKFPGRTHKPWPYEFPGARYYEGHVPPPAPQAPATNQTHIHKQVTGDHVTCQRQSWGGPITF